MNGVIFPYELDTHHLMKMTIEDANALDYLGIRMLPAGDNYVVIVDGNFYQLVMSYQTPIGTTINQILTACEDEYGIVPGHWSLVSREGQNMIPVECGTFVECFETLCAHFILQTEPPATF